MANRHTIYRRQTKAYQRNIYNAKYGTISKKEQLRNKYLSIAGIIVPGILVLITFFLGKISLFLASLILWIICIGVVFWHAQKEQKRFIRNLKDAGMSRREYMKYMSTQTKKQSQLKRYAKLWDSIN